MQPIVRAWRAAGARPFCENAAKVKEPRRAAALIVLGDEQAERGYFAPRTAAGQNPVAIGT